MNKTRRAALLVSSAKIELLRNEVQSLRYEEEEYCDNIPEHRQGSKHHYEADEAVEALIEAVDHLNNAIVCIKTILED